MDVTDQDMTSLFGQYITDQFEVPDYQRGYDWSRDDWSKLWQDIQNIGDRADEHFFGTIIILDKKSSENVIEIVDGQQRLVTVSLIAMAVRDLTETNSTNHTVNLILNKNKESGQRRVKYDVDDDDRKYARLYNENISETDNTGLKKAYNWFKRKITDKFENPAEVINKIEKLIIVRTELSDPVKAYPIFQAQNDRGKDVEPHILARSRVYGAAERDDGVNAAMIKGKWRDTIEGRLTRRLKGPRYRKDDLKIRRPMTHILANSEVSTKTNIDKGDFYGVFERVVSSKNDIEHFVDWFQSQVDTYINQVSSMGKYDIGGRNLSNDEKRALLYFNSVNTQAELLTLAIYQTVSDDRQGLRKNCFKLAATLGMRLELTGYTGRDKTDPIYSAASDVIGENNGTEIKRILRKKVQSIDPTPEEIKTAIIESDMYAGNQYDYRTILKFASLEEQTNTHRLSLEDLIIDHIVPKNTFEKNRYSEWRSGIDRDEFADRKHSIGNLMILDKQRHKDIRVEESVSAKMSKLKNTDYTLAEEVVDAYEKAGGWTDEVIDERTKYLAGKLEKRWSI